MEPKSYRLIIRVLSYCVSALITGILLYAVFTEISIEKFFQILTNTSPVLFFVFILLAILGVILRALRYQLMLATITNEKTPSKKEILVVTGIRNAFVDMLPARLGELSFFYVLTQYGISFTACTSVFGFCLVLDLVVLVAIVALGLVAAPLFISFTSLLFGAGSFSHYISLFLLLSGILTIGIYVIYRAEKLIHIFAVIIKKILPRLPKLTRAIEEIGADFAIIRNAPNFSWLVFLTLCLRAAKYSALYTLLLAVVSQFGLGVKDFNFFTTTASFVIAEASASLPISGLMGFGAYEGAWGLAMTLSGVKIKSISALIFAVHLLSQVVGYSIGMLSLLIFWGDLLRKRK